MKKTLLRWLALALTASMMLAGCSTGSGDTNSGSGEETQTGEETTAEGSYEISDLVIQSWQLVNYRPLISCTVRMHRTLKI